MRYLRALSLLIVAVTSVVVACSGGDAQPSIDLYEYTGEDDGEVVIDPDDFEIEYRFNCEPLNCKTECALQGDDDWFDCESPFRLTDHTEDFDVEEGQLRFEVRATKPEQDPTEPDQADLLVLYDFDSQIDGVEEYQPHDEDSPFYFPDEYTATCERDYGDYAPDDCQLDCRWEAEGLDEPVDADCSLDAPFDLEFPDDDLDYAHLIVQACATNFGGSPEDEHCNDQEIYLFYPSPPEWTDHTAGGEHACAILEDESLWCWGNNTAGQLGLETDDTPVDAAAEIDPDIGHGGWDYVSAGEEHTCAIDTDGALYCWGEEALGRLGTEPDDNRRPALVDEGPWLSVSAGYTHTCAIDDDEDLYCWGDNQWDKLGTADGDDYDEPEFIMPPPNSVNWLEVTASEDHTCGIALTDGLERGYCWGRQSDGRLGNSASSGTSEHPSEIDITSSLAFDTISAGEEHTCALIDDGRAHCWGSGADGRLGIDDPSLDPPFPERVEDGADYLDIAAGVNHTCGINPDSEAMCWGDNGDGQLGEGADADDSPVPVAVDAPDDERFESIVVGEEFSCAIDDEGVLFCWGNGHRGRLGTADTDDRTTPTEISWPQGRLVPDPSETELPSIGDDDDDDNDDNDDDE